MKIEKPIKTEIDLIEDENKKIRLDAQSTDKEFSIIELRSMPEYCGLVECNASKTINFLMLLINNDDGVALRWLWHHAYEAMTMALWVQLAAQSKTIFDIGAHTGVYTIAAKLANDEATVIAMEPHSLNHARMLANLRLNKLSTNNIFNVAASDRDGLVPFSVSTESWYHSAGGTLGERKGAVTVPVQAVNLGNFYNRQKMPINLMKIDTEGFEASILKSMTNVIGECSPDLFLESIDDQSSEICTQLLKDFGYSFYLINDKESSALLVDDLSPKTIEGHSDRACLNRLATKRSAQDIHSLIKAAQDSLPRRHHPN